MLLLKKELRAILDENKDFFKELREDSTYEMDETMKKKLKSPGYLH